MTKLQVTFEAALEPVSFGGFRLIGIKATIHVETNEENRMKAEECVEQTKENSLLLRVVCAGVSTEVTTEIDTKSAAKTDEIVKIFKEERRRRDKRKTPN